MEVCGLSLVKVQVKKISIGSQLKLILSTILAFFIVTSALSEEVYAYTKHINSTIQEIPSITEKSAEVTARIEAQEAQIKHIMLLSKKLSAISNELDEMSSKNIGV